MGEEPGKPRLNQKQKQKQADPIPGTLLSGCLMDYPILPKKGFQTGHPDRRVLVYGFTFIDVLHRFRGLGFVAVVTSPTVAELDLAKEKGLMDSGRVQVSHLMVKQ